jgi:DNA polymerase-3 subunit epsilon/ATP-dependent DNA helicase DinG
LEESLVALDLEILDSPPTGREIVEIGAVRFFGGRELETFECLVKTRATLSYRLSQLTGITHEALAAAIPLDQALDQLDRFLGQSPIVGQSVELDLDQLSRAGLRGKGPPLDTYELANLMLPGLPAYDLSSIARALGLALDERRHRALPDARLARRVFEALTERVSALDVDTLRQVNRVSEPLRWPLRRVFQGALELKAGPDAPPHSSIPNWLQAAEVALAGHEQLRPRDQIEPLDPEQVASLLRPGGAMATALADFEERHEQLEMLRAVAEAFNNSEHLIVEAGTGTGKSLAYLLPAAKFALENGRRVVVSTNTINLQDQLSQKEVPSLRSATGLPVRATVLKGRSNYLCLRRWQTLARSEELSEEDRTLLVKTLLWLPVTTTGDRSELRLSAREEEAWNRVNAQQESCSPLRCAYHRLGYCFLARVRKQAEASHLLIVNHALLLADMASGSRAIPEFRHLVVDEAHHLEDEATAQLGWHLSPRELLGRLERMVDAQDSGPGSLLLQAAEHVRAGSQAGSASRVEALVQQLAGLSAGLLSSLTEAFDHLATFAHQFGQRQDSGAITLRLSSATRAQPRWSELEIDWDNQNQRLLRLVQALKELDKIGERLELDEHSRDSVWSEIAQQADFWEQARERLWRVLVEADADLIAWLTIGRNEGLTVAAAPLHVGKLLDRELFCQKDSVVLTSATLSAGRSFEYLRERLGLQEASELILGSPFDYERSTLVFIPSDIPEPTAPGYQQSVERVLGEVIAALDGRTLALFTSYSQLRATYNALRGPLEARDIVLLGQRMDGSSRARLLETFKTGERVALLGTSSFWEGVDVVGEALSCVVIARLPFTTPGDPVYQARSELFSEPFTQYAVPQAILRFRQGFGRLIRSRDDRGLIVVLDRRIKSRHYGRAFLGSLPRCTVREGPASQAGRIARQWLETAPAEPSTVDA